MSVRFRALSEKNQTEDKTEKKKSQIVKEQPGTYMQDDIEDSLFYILCIDFKIMHFRFQKHSFSRVTDILLQN